jgi:hypothetical protein
MSNRYKHIEKFSLALQAFLGEEFLYICKLRFYVPGEMAEWSKAHAWKVCIRQKRIMGSNPILSAINNFSPRSLDKKSEREKICKPCIMAINRNLISKVMIGIGFTVVVIFFGLGIALITLPVYIDPFNALPRNMELVLSLFFIAYGLFRFAKLIQQIKEQKRKENYDE